MVSPLVNGGGVVGGPYGYPLFAVFALHALSVEFTDMGVVRKEGAAIVTWDPVLRARTTDI